jgi:hypothetical protein
LLASRPVCETKPDYPERVVTLEIAFALRSESNTPTPRRSSPAVSEGKAYCVDSSTLNWKTLDPEVPPNSPGGTMVNSHDQGSHIAPGGHLNVRLKDGAETDLTVARDRAREFKARIAC